MKKAFVGGQAVIEGVMMKHNDDYAIAVRKPDKSIEVKIDKYGRPSYRKTTKNKITSAINPKNKNVVSVNRLHTKTYKELIKNKKFKRR